MSIRVLPLRAIAAVVFGAVLLAGCSGLQGELGVQTTTTTSSSTTTPAPGGSEAPTSAPATDPELPGLWVLSPGAIVDETGAVFAEPAAGSTEVLRSVLDDGQGGVYYLRCGDADTTACAIEHSSSSEQAPTVIGTGVALLATGVWDDRSVIAVVYDEPAATVDPASDDSSSIGRLVEPTTGEIVATFRWWGAQNALFGFDAEATTAVGCLGQGESCQFLTTEDLAAEPVPLQGVDDDRTVTSLVLDSTGTAMVWLEMELMDGAVIARYLNLESGERTDTELRTSDEAGAEDAVTNGTWAAVRVGQTVYFTELGDGDGAGTRTVATDTIEIAVKSMGSSGSGSVV